MSRLAAVLGDNAKKSDNSWPGYQICIHVVRPDRFERPTPRFEAWCSIQLSYGRKDHYNYYERVKYHTAAKNRIKIYLILLGSFSY
jgi:hypothetical protein